MAIPNPEAVPPTQVRAGQIAAVVLGLHCLAVAGFAVAYLVEVVLGRSFDPVVAVMMGLLLAGFAVGLGYVAVGLWRRHGRAPAPAVAWCLLLIPASIVFLVNGFWVGWFVLASALLGVFSTFAMGRVE